MVGRLAARAQHRGGQGRSAWNVGRGTPAVGGMAGEGAEGREAEVWWGRSHGSARHGDWGMLDATHAAGRRQPGSRVLAPEAPGPPSLCYLAPALACCASNPGWRRTAISALNCASGNPLVAPAMAALKSKAGSVSCVVHACTTAAATAVRGTPQGKPTAAGVTAGGSTSVAADAAGAGAGAAPPGAGCKRGHCPFVLCRCFPRARELLKTAPQPSIGHSNDILAESALSRPPSERNLID
jgi:hypothetical protein